MVFILLLIASTAAIAGAAAYFSVYGLAYTFSGVFWSVVVMGAALEAGKLVAASFLYRYWTQINFALKAYLMSGIVALMVLTSIGIFGYLASGYQQDVLPLKQKQEQVALLEDEKARALARKQQIDNQMSTGPTITSVNRADGTIDPNAARVLRESMRSRDAQVRQYKAEQETVTKRVADLDVQLLALKQELIKVEAHIGPIAYIATAFGLSSDDATKYLIFVIIFAFDPMAVALTLATNIALRLRREEKEKARNEKISTIEPNFGLPPLLLPSIKANTTGELIKREVEDARGTLDDVDFTKTEVEDARGTLDDVDFTQVKLAIDDQRGNLDNIRDITPETEAIVDAVVLADVPSTPRVQPYSSNHWIRGADTSPDKLRELINHHRFLKAKQDNGDILPKDEQWELHAIEDVLRKNGVDMYL